MGSNMEHDKAKMDAFFESVVTEELVMDGTIAQDATQQQKLWFLRENIAEGCLRQGYTYKYDISLPVEKMYDLVEVMRKRFLEHREVLVTGYGHLGDGNLHLNIVAPAHREEFLALIEPFVYEYTCTFCSSFEIELTYSAEHRGSVSAEHGIGVMKPSALHYSKSAEMIAVMKAVKKTLDPNCILNPYKVLPSE